jgi:hypothetical protein
MTKLGHNGRSLTQRSWPKRVVVVVFKLVEVVVPEEEDAEVVVGSTTYTWYVVLLDQTSSICHFLDNMYACLNFVCLRYLQNHVKKKLCSYKYSELD